MNAGRISSISQYLPTSSSQFVLVDVVGLLLQLGRERRLGEHQDVVDGTRRGGPEDRLLVAVATFDGDRVEQRAVDDGGEPFVESGERW